MVCLLYQGNDEILTHINCLVSDQDAERESALAKRVGKIRIANKPKRKGLRHQQRLMSGLTVDKPSISAKSRSSKATDDENSTALNDVFLPSRGATTQANLDSKDTLLEFDTSTSEMHSRGREVFGFQSERKLTGLRSIIEKQYQGQNKDSPMLEQHNQGNQKHNDIDSDEILAEKEAKRRRFTNTISKMNDANSGEDDEEEADQDSEDESDSDNDQSQPQDSFMGTNVHDASQAQKSFFEEDEMGAERYFQDLYQKSKTSNNTLSKLPTLEHADFIQAIKKAPAKHSTEMEMLLLLYEEQFPQWYFELMSGFNLLIYGYGSKRQLLTKFATTILTDAPLIIVNGYFPTLTIKEILDKISAGALQYTGPSGTLQEQVAFIHAYFEQPDRSVKKLYLLIHNIDGSSLRSEKTQSALSLLASCPYIHLVASMDHINTNILWDTVKSARFRWVWHELTTFKSYLTETSFENSIMVRQGELGPRGIQFVLASLTSNGKGLFRILAEHQIQSEEEAVSAGASTSSAKNYMDWGMAYNTLFKKCQENFLVSNAVTFRTQLTEFRDHRIVHSRKGADGVEILFIPLSANILESILEKMN
ncbi:Origin recognition complex subunit 2 [Entomortierella beljakovae]|nr:Origin recognition complex subunit 2 [Entomortierella beljakovae]